MEGGIYYFEEQTTFTKPGAISLMDEEAECWKVHKEDEHGGETLFLDNTHGSIYGFYPLDDKRVRGKIKSLKERANLLGSRLGDIVRGVESTIGALVFNPQGEIVLLESPKWTVKYIVPCGHIEPGEPIEDTVRREVKEETGLEAYDVQFQNLNELITSSEFHDERRHFLTHGYTCKTDGGNIKTNEEATEGIWIPPEKAVDLDIDRISRASIEQYLAKN